jgi:uncharacterized protein (DUF433 family)
MSSYWDYLSVDPEVLFGKPAIKGTRIPVELVIDELAAGMPFSELLEEYPRLTIEAVQAALAFAADAVRGQVSYPVEKVEHAAS